MNKISNYNIHNILKFQIRGVKENGSKFSDLNSPFSYFKVEEDVKDPDIILNIGKFKPCNDNCYVVDHKYYVKNNYLYCKDSYGRANWQVEISGFENGKTIVNYYGKIFGLSSILIPDFLSQNILLRPLIEYRLAQKELFLIHSAGVEKEGKAYLFAGRGGSFKTSIVMDLVRNSDFNFMGDDRIIIHKNKILNFPIHILTFDFRINNLPDENFRNVLDKFRLIKNLHNRKISNYNIPLAEKSVLKSIFFLKKTCGNHSIKKSVVSVQKCAAKLVANNKMEMIKSPMMMGMDFGCFYRYMLAYSFVFPESKITKYWENLKDNLEKILEKTTVYDIELPKQYSANIYEKLNELIREME